MGIKTAEKEFEPYQHLKEMDYTESTRFRSNAAPEYLDGHDPIERITEEGIIGGHMI